MMALTKQLIIWLSFALQVLCRQPKEMDGSKLEVSNESFKRQMNLTQHATASNTRRISLYSRSGKLLEILPSGRMRGTSNGNSKDIQLEVQTFGIRYRRFRRADSETYLAIGKYGKPYTTTTPGSETLFEAFLGKNGWIRYQSVRYGWVIALKKNGRMKKAARPNTNKGRSHKSMQFLTLFAEKVPWKKYAAK